MIEFLLGWSVRSAVLLLLAWAGALLLRRRASGRRLLWVLAICLACLLPILDLLPSPQIEVPVTATFQAPVASSRVLIILSTGSVLIASGQIAGCLVRHRIFCRAARVELNKGCEVRISSNRIPSVAMTWGVLRPAVLLPRTAEDWEPERLRAVLVHELAHVKRRDCLYQCLANVLCAIQWFNPMVWLASWCLRAECESTADETVLEQGVRPSDYASALLKTVVDLQSAPAWAATAFLRPGELERRIRGIVDPGRGPRHLSKGCARAIATVAAGLAVVVAWTQPTVLKPQGYSNEFWEGYRAGQAYSRTQGTSSSPAPPEELNRRITAELYAKERAHVRP